MGTSGIPQHRSFVRPANSTAKQGRRSSARFPIELPVRYKVAKSSGSGRTINIGSGGALMTISHPVKPGERIELTISWPVLLYQKVRLNLIAHGTILRVAEGRAAVKFEQYNFRTAGAASRHHGHAAEHHRAPSHRPDAPMNR